MPKKIKLVNDNKHYVNPKEFYNEIVLSKSNGHLSPLAVKMCYKIANECSKNLRYKYPSDKDDCIQTAMLLVWDKWNNFDVSKSDNAFAYFTQIIKVAFAKGFNELHPVKVSKCISISNINMYNI